MDGSNSNTSGADVANIGFWPLGVLPWIIAQGNQVINSLKGLQTGEQLPATVDFAAFSATDRIADATMAEIVRRLVVTIERQEQGNVLFQPTPPDDHTKAWMPTDAVSGLPIDGKIKVWDEGTQTWIFADTAAGDAPLQKRQFKQRVAAGASTVNIPITDIQTDDYSVYITFTTQNDDGSWAAAPGSYPSAFGYLVTNKTNTTLTIAFYGVPTGGMMAEGKIEENE